MRTMAAGEFKAKCLKVMDEVKATGEPVLITKRGKPVARITPDRDESVARPSILGRLREWGTIHGDIVSSEHTPEEWERISEESWADFGLAPVFLGLVGSGETHSLFPDRTEPSGVEEALAMAKRTSQERGLAK